MKMSIAPKGGDPLIVPLIDEAREVLGALKSNRVSEFVFLKDNEPLTPPQITQAFIDTRDKVGIEFRFHDLRHDFATKLVKKGVELYRVSKLLSQRSLNMTKRYAHLDISDLRDAVNVLSGGDYKALPVLTSRKVKAAKPSRPRV